MISLRLAAVVAVCVSVVGACAGDATHKTTDGKDSGNADGTGTGGVGGTGGSAGQSGSGGSAGQSGSGGSAGQSGSGGAAGAAGVAGAAGADASTDVSADVVQEATPDADGPLVCRPAPIRVTGGGAGTTGPDSGDAMSDAGDAMSDAGDAMSDAGDAMSDAGDAMSDAAPDGPDLGQWRDWANNVCAECPAIAIDCPNLDLPATSFDPLTRVLTLQLGPGVAEITGGSVSLQWDAIDADGGYIYGSASGTMTVNQNTLTIDLSSEVPAGVVAVYGLDVDVDDACGYHSFFYTSYYSHDQSDAGTPMAIYCEF